MAYKVENIIYGAAAIYFSTASSLDNEWTSGGNNGSIDAPAVAAGTSFASTMEAATKGATPAWKSAGFTTEGVEVEYSPEFKDVEVDQLLDAALIYRTKQSVTVKTTLAEATLENLMFVWAIPADKLKTGGGTSFEGDALGVDDKELGIYEGGLGEAPVERSMVFVGAAPRTGGKTERIYNIRRVLQTQASSHGLKRAEETVFPVSFRCLPNPNKTGAGYGTIRDRKVS